MQFFCMYACNFAIHAIHGIHAILRKQMLPFIFNKRVKNIITTYAILELENQFDIIIIKHLS